VHVLRAAAVERLASSSRIQLPRAGKGVGVNRAALLAAVRDVIEVLDRLAEREGEVRAMLEGDEVTEMRRVLAEAEEIRKVLD
jgi:hypothetical protein